MLPHRKEAVLWAQQQPEGGRQVMILPRRLEVVRDC